MALVKMIESLRWLNNDENGNPRWRIYWTDGTSNDTAPGAQIAYAIENDEYQNVPLSVTTKRRQVTDVHTI